MTSVKRPEDTFVSIIVGLMIGCVALSTVSAGEELFRGWDGSYLVGLCALTGLGANYSFRLCQGVLSRHAIALRTLELGSLFIVRNLCADVVEGRGLVHAGVPSLNLSMIWLFAPVFLSWLVGTRSAADIRQLNLPADQEPASGRPYNRLVALVITGAVILVVSTWLARGGIRLFHFHAAPLTGPTWNVFLYAALGAVLLSHAQYSARRGEWRQRSLATDPQLGMQWTRYGLVLAGAAAIVALLPVSILALFDPITWVWNLSHHVVAGIGADLHSPGNLLSSGTTSTVPSQGPALSSGPARNVGYGPPNPIHTRVSSAPPGTHSPTGFTWPPVGAVLKALMLWSVVAGALTIRFQLWRRRRWRSSDGVPTLGSAFAGLSGLWSALRRLLTGYSLARFTATLRMPIPGGAVFMKRPSMPSTRRPHLTNSPTLSSRRKVIRYHQSVVRQAERRGVSRLRWQTPREFSAALSPTLNSARTDMALLTEQFGEARYSHHSIGSHQASEARASHRRVHRDLRRRRKKERP